MRAVVFALALGLLAPLAFLAEAASPKDITWDALVPREDAIESLADRLAALGLEEDGSSRPNRLGGIVSHGGAWLGADSVELGSKLVTELDGETVRIAGYTVPLDYNEDGTRNLLLVPFIGACIHVPPPPPNQIIAVTLPEARHFEYFEPVFITGPIQAIPKELELAEVGYQISATNVEPYTYDDAWYDNPGYAYEPSEEEGYYDEYYEEDTGDAQTD
ncbi:MAG: DUF3299 domain-containing protein [Pseudomonadota bacterium]